MTPFERALALTLGIEKGYSNDRADRGGATMWGVTHKTYDAYRRRHGLPLRDVRLIEPRERDEIYQKGYWFPAGCDLLPECLSACHFDAAVNHGHGQAVRFLQQAVGALPDGIFGPKTRAALAAALEREGEAEVIRTYLDVRRDYYDHLIESDPTQERFRRGWANRIDHLQGVLLA